MQRLICLLANLPRVSQRNAHAWTPSRSSLRDTSRHRSRFSMQWMSWKHSLPREVAEVIMGTIGPNVRTNLRRGHDCGDDVAEPWSCAPHGGVGGGDRV